MANDLTLREQPRQSRKNDINSSKLELKLEFSNVDVPISSPHPRGAEFYQDFSDDSESEQDDYWESYNQKTGSVEALGASSSASTITSSTLDRVSFDPDEGNVLLGVRKLEGLVQQAVRQRVKPTTKVMTIEHLEEIISDVRDTLAQNLGAAFLEAKPSDPEICYYVFHDIATHDHQSLNWLCQLYFARLAAGGMVTSNGRTEASFKITAKDGSCWEAYAPHSAFLALHERLLEQMDSIPGIPSDLLVSTGGPLDVMEKKETFLNRVLELPVEMVLGTNEIVSIFKPIADSPIGFDEVYDESLCLRLAEHCCWGER